ncbi:MAG TPA: TIGR03790 family protein [Lacipirellulaceae bacterium]|nr:TIGR03790 family protein [Lacipirellulaceae bacterium]
MFTSLSTPREALAGGGPENVFLVVNLNSDSSKTVANHYIELRKIPPNNVFYVDWKGSLGVCSGKNFREQILLPALKAIEDRKLTRQIDYLVYSTDFPWRMELRSVFPNDEFKAPFDPVASSTGATYLAAYMASENPGMVMPTANWYVPGPIEPNVSACQSLANVPSRGFRSRYSWDQNGKRTEAANSGQRYLLSTTLGITRGRGNTIEEVISYLRRSVAADGTRPRGTIYFMWNRNVRSTVRDKCYASIAAQINQAGGRATVRQGRLPDGAKDVAGLMVGLESFDVAASGMTIQPGAICEHLTSAGGVMTAGAHQTPLSDFLRQGATGSSGTVTEPRAIQAKFPLPSLQLHYVRGCSLAEAFYQSVSGPYQLLIVGDPLCQPWAIAPRLTVKGISDPKKVSGTLSIMPSPATPGGRPIGAFELFVDGRLVARSSPGKALPLDTTKLPDGYHELRVVGIQADAIETQGRQIVPLMVRNREAPVEFQVAPQPGVSQLGKLRMRVKQPGATSIAIRQNSREVGRVQGESGELEIPAAMLGRGPVTLQAFSDGPAATVSQPVRISVN